MTYKTYKPGKLGQTDLDIGLWLESISRSVLAGLQVCMSMVMICSTLDWLTHTHTQTTFNQLLYY